MNLKYLVFAFLIFFTAGLVCTFFAMQPIQPQRVASDVARNLGEEIQRLDAAAAFILSNLHDEEARALLALKGAGGVAF